MAATEFIPVRPYFVANRDDRPTLTAELEEIETDLRAADEGERLLDWRDRARLEERRKTVKRLLNELGSQERQSGTVRQVQQASRCAGGRVIRSTDAAGNVTELRL